MEKRQETGFGVRLNQNMFRDMLVAPHALCLALNSECFFTKIIIHFSSVLFSVVLTGREEAETAGKRDTKFKNRKRSTASMRTARYIMRPCEWSIKN